jgi:A/G-specific adenine glycosylase
LRRRVLAWFQRDARSLPWRETDDAYLVWISEIMLQQTQVATVIPYFERFRERFPTPAALAAADEEEVLRHWEGLGYYRRARQLHTAAQQIVSTHDGAFPEDFDAVLALPGIGRYTAGAILSIAKGQRQPIVEANTQRLYSRLLALQLPPTQKAANRLLWEFAAAILPRKSAGHFNQAMMELGSLVCTPRKPQCDRCPLRRLCAAHAEGLEETIPGKVKRMVYEDRQEFALLIREAAPPDASSAAAPTRYLVYQVPAGRRWGGLWDFPRYGGAEAATPDEAVRRAQHAFGLSVELGPHETTLRHGVTRYRITLDAYHATCASSAAPAAPRDAPAGSEGDGSEGDGDEVAVQWRTPSELVDLPLNVTGRKLANRLRGRA